ncbi:MAG: histidine phosphatase family protein [Anaerolineae bacterium]|jgi:broad specificity phosphatase PhoE/ubiquinone/menaquinone biosynthesis C-methylase UbiE|nr:histidine phosphatase family protein [Anaerolineae bacterium]
MTAPVPTASSPAIQLVLVRHAESLRNREGEKVAIDTGLTELGWRQAHAVAEWLAARYRPDALYSSDLIRSQQTAEVICNRLKLPLTIDDGLAEADFQYWDELPYRWERPMDVWADVWQPNPDVSPLYASFRARLRDALVRLLNGRTSGTLVAVTHGGAVGTLMRSLFGGHHLAVTTANTGVTQFTWERNHWRLEFHNSTAHLDSLTAPKQPAAAPTAAPAAPWANGQAATAIVKHYQRVAASDPGAGLGERELREMVRLASPRGSEQALDVATGTGAVALAFAPHVESVLGIDLSPAMLELAETERATRGINNVRFSLGQIGVAPLPENAFDIITCHDLLLYVADVPALFALFGRLLRPGGRVVMDELVGSDDPVKRATLEAIMLRRDPGMVEVLSAGEIEAALRSAGFRVARAERHTVTRDLDEWLERAAADEATRGAVRQMIEAGLDADAAGLNARWGREGTINFTETRVRLLAEREERPA